MIRVITAEEYDAAAGLHPGFCPLVSAGDTRPGRRLLADAAADAARSLADALREDGVPPRLAAAARSAAARLVRLVAVSAAAVGTPQAAAGQPGWLIGGSESSGVCVCFDSALLLCIY
jgi:hypothetical protein